MGTLGTEALAAHQIVFQTIVVVFMVPLGISYATTVRVGQWLGQRNFAGIRQAAWVSMSISTLFIPLRSQRWDFNLNWCGPIGCMAKAKSTLSMV
jgi:MATE family multidrug resistance protein